MGVFVCRTNNELFTTIAKLIRIMGNLAKHSRRWTLNGAVQAPDGV